MPLSSAQVRTVREWVGDTPTTPELDALFDELGSVSAVALSVLRTRRANLAARPKSFAIPGEYSETQRDLKELDTLIETIVDGDVVLDTNDGNPRVKHLVRFGTDCFPGR